MKTTIQDIADMCHVSRGTVDRVLHNRPNVHPNVRRAVLDAIERTGYRTPAARDETPLMRTLGVILPGWTDKYFLNHSVNGIETALRAIKDTAFCIAPYRMNSRSLEEHLTAIRTLRRSGIDGLLLNAPTLPAIVDEVNTTIENGIPVMTVLDELPPCACTCYIGQDTVRSGRVAAGLMAKYIRPEQRVLVVTGSMDFHSHRERALAFISHLGELGFPPETTDLIQCHEFFQETSDGVFQSLQSDQRIRHIYMAAQSVTGCIDGIRRTKTERHITVICNDRTAAARQYLQSGDIDFVIGQSISQTMNQAIWLFYSLLREGMRPKNDKLYSDLTIYTRPML